MFLMGPLEAVKILEVGYGESGSAVDQQAVYHAGGLAPPNILAEAKSDEHQRKLRVPDLTSPGHQGTATF